MEDIKLKKEKIINNIILILFCIGLFISSFVVGVPFELYTSTQGIAIYFSILSLIYFIYFLYKKYKFKIRAIDILIFLFCLTPAIPLIAKSYITTSGTINHILIYLTIFDIYFLTRLLAVQNKNTKKFILNTIIISAVIMLIYGIDNMTLNIFQKLIGDSSFYYYDFKELRMEGFFRYANTFSIYMAFVYFLIIYKLLNCKDKKIELLYAAISILIFYGMILANSRLVLILFSISFILLFIFMKDIKNKNILLYSVLVDSCLGLILANATMQLMYIGNIIAIYVMLIVFILIKIILFKIIDKINTKNLILSIIVAISIFVIFISIAVNIKSKLIMFNTQYSENVVKRDVLGLEPNTYYKFSFDINACSDVSNNYEIDIIEKNKDYIDITTHKVRFDNFEGKKDIEFTSNTDTSLVYICFKSLNTKYNKYFIVNTMKINDKVESLNYLLIPETFFNRTLDINMKTKGASQRIEFIKDALKLIKENWITGIGGDGWKYSYKTVQETQYIVSETHSYLTKIMLEFGVASILIFILILIFLLIYSIKSKKYIGLFIPLFLIVIHSFLDFDMSYIYILILVFIMIGMLIPDSSEEKSNSKSKKITCIILVSLVLIISNIFNTTSLISKLISLQKDTDFYAELRMYDLANKWSPYDKYYLLQKIKLEQNYPNFSNEEELERDLEKLYKQEPALKE